MTFLFVYFDCFVEVKVFAKEFFDVNLVLYKTLFCMLQYDLLGT